MKCIQEFNGFQGKVFILNVQTTYCRLGNSLCSDWNCPTLCWFWIQDNSGWLENKKPETIQRSSNWPGLGALLFSTGLLYLSMGAGKQENRTGKIPCKQTHRIRRLSQLLTCSVLLMCGRKESEKAPQQVLPPCLPCKQPWPRYNMTPESRATHHPRWQCRGFSCKYFSIAWLILWTGTNSSYARGWNTSLSNPFLDLLQLTFSPNSLCSGQPSLFIRGICVCVVT